MTAHSILKELKSLGNENIKRMLMNNHGIKEPCFGVKIGDMKPIVRRIKKDYQLALDLYDTGNYDAMYLAGLITDDEKMTKRDLQRWASKAYGGSLASSTVAGVAADGPHGWDMALKWIESPRERVACAGWSTLGAMMGTWDDEDLDLPKLKQLLTRVKREIHKAPDAVRYQMNNFVIALGCGVKSLSKQALDAAEKIGPVTADLGDNSCRIPFAPDYIRKVEKRGTIGKKRKSAKC